MKKEIEEQVVIGKRLGRHVEHDPLSRNFPFGVVARKQELRTRRWRRYGVFDQGNIGSCTGNAAVGAMNTSPLHKRGVKLLTQQHAVKVYSLATTLDEFDGKYPPQDTGSSGLAAAKALRKLGYIKSYRHAFSVEEALAALMVRPVITGVPWYEGFDTPDSNGHVNPTGQMRGGHEFEVVAFQTGRNFATNLDDSLVVAVNSWGTGWGKNGRFVFTVATWRKLLEEQGDVTILDA